MGPPENAAGPARVPAFKLPPASKQDDERSLAPAALLLKTREAAKALSLSERMVWQLTNSGELPSVRIGRALRIAVEDLEAFIARRRRTGGVR